MYELIIFPFYSPLRELNKKYAELHNSVLQTLIFGPNFILRTVNWKLPEKLKACY